MTNYLLAQLDQINPLSCPCGFTRRAFGFPDTDVASVHLVEIQADARVHYHKRLTEIYLVLEGQGQVELDGQLFPVKPLTAICIRPGCRHRAVGKMRIANLVIPAFDPADEWFDSW
jgi:quercetin dioxygenase-like cupin family protein